LSPVNTNGYVWFWNSYGASVTGFAMENSQPFAVNTSSLAAYTTINNGSTWSRSTPVVLNETGSDQANFIGATQVGSTFAIAYYNGSNISSSVSITQDGMSWSTYKLPNLVNAIGYLTSVRGMFVLVGDANTPDAWVSKDAVNWTYDSSGLLTPLTYAHAVF
jgi:hypothetical protein